MDPQKQKVDKNTCYFCKIKAKDIWFIVHHTLGLFSIKGFVCFLEFKKNDTKCKLHGLWVTLRDWLRHRERGGGGMNLQNG